jgi:hypothetical protein
VIRRGLVEGGWLRWKVLTVILLGAFSGLLSVSAAERGPTIVIKKDEHRIAGVGTNGITRWTSSVARDEEEVSAVNQSGNTAMVSVTNKKTGKTRILNYDAEKGILRFSQSVN